MPTRSGLRRCWDGDCPPWPRGACAPCPVVVTISCACSELHFDVPCGAEAGKKPPRCPKPCRILPLCRHGSKCKPHRCHYGACPPCQLSCEMQLSFGHKCNQRFHAETKETKTKSTTKRSAWNTMPSMSGNCFKFLRGSASWSRTNDALLR